MEAPCKRISESEEAKMNELKIFENEEFGKVRTLVIDNEPWFVGKDVCIALGYSDPKSGTRKNVDDEDKRVCPVGTPFGKQGMTVINESGLYSLIFGSKLETAKKFKHWVTSEVLPTLRKTGTYSVSTTCQYPITPAAIDSATNAGRLIERIMKTQGIPPHEIAMAIRSIFIQAGIDMPDYVVRIPAYEQLTLSNMNY